MRIIPFKFSSPSKQMLMEGLASSIHQQRIHYPDGVLRAELEAFEYEYTSTGVRYSAPEGLHDDAVCALALAVHLRSDLSARRFEVETCDYVLTAGN